MIFLRKILFTCFILVCGLISSAQQDSVAAKKDTSLFVSGKLDTSAKKLDTLKRAKHSPRKAAIRSAIIPGWGQVYNGKYWKVPIVYTAIGVPAYFFFYNEKWYQRTKYAYAVASYPNPSADSLAKVYPDLRPFVDRGETGSLVNFRNEFRKNMDYSVLFFLAFWALNIVDATVDAHLKDFNVTPDLSLKLKPTISTGNYGLSLVFDLHKPKPRGLVYR
jgi:hypothetical protein